MRRHLSTYRLALFVGLLFGVTTPALAMLCGQLVTETGGKVAVIINVKSSGTLFVPELQRRGYGLAHIQSFPDDQITLPAEVPFIASLGRRVNGVIPSWVELTDRARELKPDIVIAGTEGAVRLKAQMERALGIPTYTEEQVEAFRNKYMQAMIVSRAGVRVPHQTLARTAKEALDWIHGTLFAKHRRQWPVFLKPNTSSGSEDVFRCWNDQEVLEKFNRIFGKLNKNLELNDAVLVQENLNRSGKAFEVVFDGNSWGERLPNGEIANHRHLHTDSWQYKKRGIVYDYDIMIPYSGKIPSLDFESDDLLRELVRQDRLRNDGNLQEELRREGFKALSALKLIGASHSEWMYDPAYPEDGFAYIELGNRTQGGYSQMLVKEVTGYNQIDYTLDTEINRLNPTLFLSRLQYPQYEMRKFAMVVNLITQRPGAKMAKPEQYLPFLVSIPEYHHPVFPAYEPDGILPETIDLKTSPGEVRLTANTYEQLMAALAKLRDAEAKGLFENWE